MSIEPSQGEIWEIDLGDPVGHEQGFKRPALVISVDEFNHGPAGLVVVAPITKRKRSIPWHVEVSPPEGALARTSQIMVEQQRVISKDRLIRPRGKISGGTFEAVQKRLRRLFDL